MFDRVPTTFTRWVAIELAALLLVGALIGVYSRLAPGPETAISAGSAPWVPSAAPRSGPPPNQAGGQDAAAQPPQSSPTPAAPSPTRAGPITYKVQPGETLSQIAEKHGVSTEAIIRTNNLQTPDTLKVDQELIIPAPGAPTPTIAPTVAPTQAPAVPTAVPAPAASGPTKYKVQPGDTLNTIAQKHNVTLEALIKANDLSNADDISIDQELTIP